MELDKKVKFDALEKMSLRITQHIVDKINGKKFKILPKKEYFKKLKEKNKEMKGITPLDLTDFADKDINKDISFCGTFMVEMDKQKYLKAVIVEIGYLKNAYSPNANVAISGSMRSNEPSIIYIHIFMPEKVKDKNLNRNLRSELEIELLRTIRHELQHSFQYNIMDKKEYDKSIVESAKIECCFDTKFDKIWEYDKVYFANKNEIEAFLKEFILIYKVTGKDVDTLLDEMIEDHLGYIYQKNFEVYDEKDVLYSLACNKSNKKEKNMLKEVLETYKEIRKGFWKFIKKYKSKLCYLEK
jgi:hypothetical protein